MPATPVRHLLVWEEGETLEFARRCARDACAELAAAGLRMAGCTVGDCDPFLAVVDISTLPPALSRWLRLDLVNRARRRLRGHRLIHVVASDRSQVA